MISRKLDESRGAKSEGIDARSKSIKSEKCRISEFQNFRIKKCGIESGNAGREWEGLGSASAHPVRSQVMHALF